MEWTGMEINPLSVELWECCKYMYCKFISNLCGYRDVIDSRAKSASTRDELWGSRMANQIPRTEAQMHAHIQMRMHSHHVRKSARTPTHLTSQVQSLDHWSSHHYTSTCYPSSYWTRVAACLRIYSIIIMATKKFKKGYEFGILLNTAYIAY